MSTPTFVNSASASATADATTLVCNVPASVSNGDLLLAHVAVATQAGVPSCAGWTLVGFLRAAASTYCGWLFARIASSEPASYTWGVTIASEYNVIVHAYRPSAGSWSTWRDAIATLRLDRSVTAVDLGLPSTLDMVDVTFMQVSRGSVTTTKPTNHTLAENPDSGGTGGGAVESAGAYYVVTAGSGSSTNWTVSGGSGLTFHLAVIDPGTTQPRMIRAFYPTFLGASATFALDVPLARSGDVLCAIIDCTASVALTPPAGWTAITNGSAELGGTEDKIAAYYRTCDNTEGATAVWTAASGTPKWSGGIVTLTNVYSLVASAAADTTSDTTWNVPALTMEAQSPAAVVIAAVTPDRSDRAITAIPGGYTSLWDVRESSSSTGSKSVAAWKFTTAADPAGVAFTADAASKNCGVHIGVGLGAAPAAGFSYGLIIG